MSTNRREFIQAGATAVIAFGVGVTPSFAGVLETLPIASLGYWAGAPKISRRFRLDSPEYLVPAESVLTGDPQFLSRAARVAVRGMWRPEVSQKVPASYSLDVVYESSGERVPYLAWSFRNAGGGSMASNNLAFDVAVDALKPVDLIIGRDADRQRISFSVNSVPDALRLRRGYYFVAMRDAGQQEAIDWSRIYIRDGATPFKASADGEGVLAMRGILGSEPVPFSYLVLFVDVAKEA